MNLVAVAGKVSHLTRIQNTSGGGGSALSTTYVTALRVAGRQVKIDGSISWAADDDYVAIVGEEHGGVLEPLAVRNDTTEYESIAEVSSYKFAVLMIVLGFVLLALMVGIFMIAWGIWLIIKTNRNKQAVAEAERMLRSIPRATATPAT